MKALEEGSNPMLLRRGIEDATDVVVSELRRGAREVETDGDLISVATIVQTVLSRVNSSRRLSDQRMRALVCVSSQPR